VPRSPRGATFTNFTNVDTFITQWVEV